MGDAVQVLMQNGDVVEQTEDCISVMARGGWLRRNRVILTARMSHDRRVVRLRAAALEGMISQRSAERVLAQVWEQLAAVGDSVDGSPSSSDGL